MSRVMRVFLFAAMAVCLCQLPAFATQLVISKVSTANPGVLNGVTFYAGDAVSIDPTAPNTTASMYAPYVFGTTQSNAKDLDAAYIRNDGKMLVSHSATGYTSSGVTIYQGDIALYDPATHTQSLYLNGNTATGRTDAFGNTTSIFKTSGGAATSEDIDGVDVLSNGHILLSGNNSGTMRVAAQGGGLLAFENEDVIDYDPVAKTATMFFDGSTYFASDENLKDFALLSPTQMIFTTAASFTVGGNTYQNNDIVQVDLNTKAMSMYMSHTLLPATPVYAIDTIAVVPEPATLLLLGLGGLLLRKK